MKLLVRPTLLICLFFFSWNLTATEIEDLLRKYLPDAKVEKLKKRDHFQEVYDIRLPQPLDHKNPSAGTFEQRIFLLHTNRKRPVVLETEGYSARLRTNELSQMLQANLIIVEYRYAGLSRPEKMDWQYLNSIQASADLHRIRKLFKKVYRKRWVSTGVSKGGTTALIYKSMYPKDVCAVVPYVAPLALAQEDSRTDTHQSIIGTDECRKKIKAFQRIALTQREQIIPMIDTFAQNQNLSFSIGTDVAFEYAVLEYPFSFWQWGADCNEIPVGKLTQEDIFNYLNTIVGFSFYSDATAEYFLPSFYQFMTELGYYGFPTNQVSDLLVAVKKPSNRIFGPKDADLTYRPEVSRKTRDYLMTKGNKILYIYGEIDTWTACGVLPSDETNAVRMVLPGGSHTTRIKDFSEADRQLMYKKLKKWVKVKITPLPQN